MSPYLITGIAAGVLGLAIGAGAMHYTVDAAALSAEQAAHAKDTAQYEANIGAVTAKAATAATAALATQTKMQQDNDAAQATITQLQGENNAIDQKYRTAVASGDQRVRVAVRNCTANNPVSSSPVPGDSQSAGGQPDSGATADLDPAVADRVLGVAADDQREIDKLAKLQAWACTVKPDAPGCSK